MITYVYDNSFEGLLTSIYDSYYNKPAPEKIAGEQEYMPDLLSETVHIKIDSSKAQKVYNAINCKISHDALIYVFYAYLSDSIGAANIIYQYVRLGFKLKKEVDMHLYDDRVIAIHALYRKVSKEAHNMEGFARFKCVRNNFYYSCIEPDHNICGLIAPHFVSRFCSQNFIIHDVKREIAVLYNTKEYIIIPFSKDDGLKLTSNAEDTIYESLWKEYFVWTDIESRKNIHLQKRLMPKRYWKYLTEMH